MERAVRVVLADDEPLLRHGLGVLLQASGRIQVVAEAVDGAGAVDAVRRHRPEVLLLDVQMPGMDGLAALRVLSTMPDAPVTAVLTTFDLDDYIAQALELGAQGFLLKDAEPEMLVRAVLDLAAGGAVLDPRITARLLPRLRGAGVALHRAQAIASLSGRERQVLGLLADGRPNANIAQALGITEATVKSYVSTLLTKLGVHNRVQAALLLHGVDTAAGGRP
ncbi:response regulator [Actinokineospora iranica]|uniref:DNA-binding response regulator, NarL/FixJ family, contains REC and HTH domains n=1 Tax=Actinokineospora iranica TaxID=1271860 RepID=A0A1G6WRR0_9PSEU|nr:response regulator transcription factor [Actinokineospora iranica]SDD67887.1 DNA-binding response regulator, NarL/FixJ family, contains REC and HTH domains [Actinokineospora iranica]